MNTWREELEEHMRQEFSQLLGDEALFEEYWRLVRPYEYYSRSDEALPPMPTLILKPLREVISGVLSFLHGWVYPSNPASQHEASKLDEHNVYETYRMLARWLRLLLQIDIHHTLGNKDDERVSALVREALSTLRITLERLEGFLGEASKAWEENMTEDHSTSISY